MKVFAVCLYDWDYKCDRDFIMEILAVFGTLQEAVQFSLSFPIHHSQDRQIEIVEFNPFECGRYAKNGKKMDGS